MLLDVCFITDIFINFLTCLKDEKGYVNTNYRDIFWHYFKGWFWIDLIASLPLELIIKLFPDASED